MGDFLAFSSSNKPCHAPAPVGLMQWFQCGSPVVFRFLFRLLLSSLLMSPTLAWAALQCSNLSGNRQRCADVVGLENQEIVIKEKDLSASVVYGEQEYCIISYNRPSRNSNPNSWSREEFDVQLDGTSFNGNFVLNNGNRRLPVTFKWKGGAPVNGSPAWETPGPGNLTSNQQGSLSCDDRPYSQAWVRFDIENSDLLGALPGAYSGSFNVDIGEGSDSYHGNVDFTVRLPTLVKISGLEDMVLTGRNNADDRYWQEQSFCVFVSGGAGYRIKASSDAGSNANFVLTNGANQIPYRVLLYGGTNERRPTTVNPGDWVEASSGSNRLDCGGSDNNILRIVVPDQWIVGKPGGTYTDTLYLTVEPT